MPRPPYYYKHIRMCLIAYCLIQLSACGNTTTLKDFDKQRWKNDKHACKNERFNLVNSLETQKKKLLSLNEMEIVEVLGKPDRNELYKRNQKFYYYFIQPAENCSNGSNLAQKLVIRFNAMGLAKEITIE